MMRSNFVALLLLASLQAGCSCSNNPPQAPQYCDINADCLSGEACADNVCVDATPPFDETGGTGTPDSGTDGTSGSDPDGGSGDSDSGTVDTDAGTGSDPDAGTGNDPDAGSGGSDAGTPGCTTDAECPGQVCNAGACADPGPSGGTCGEDVDCQSGLVCVNSVCQQPPTGCTVDADCDTGEVCFQGQCLLNTDDGDNETCIAGEVYICHVPPGDPAAAHTLCVGYKAANTHLNHGDALDQCQ